MPNWHVVGSNLAYFRSQNVTGYFGEATLGAGGAACIAKHGVCTATMTELRSWLQFSMMWDHTRDPTLLVAEFVREFYGPIAGPRVAEHMSGWESSVAELGSHLSPANWTAIEDIGGFIECSCSDGEGHPGHCPGACAQKAWITPEPVVRSAVVLTAALSELALDSANAEFHSRTERVLLSSWWILLMRWDECCEFATAAEIDGLWTRI